MAGPGLPSLAVFAPAPGGASAQRRRSASRRDVRGCRLLGCGDRVRCLPALQGPRVGAEPAGVFADLGGRGSPVRRPRCAGLRAARGLPHQRQDPRAEGGPGAQEMRCGPCPQDRPAVPVDRRQRHRVCQAGGQRGAGRQLDAAPAGRLVRPRAWFRRGGSAARPAGGSPEGGQSRGALSSACTLAGVRSRDPHRVSAHGAAGRRQFGLPRRPGRHERPARFLPQRGQGARGQHRGRAAARRHAGQRQAASLDVG